MNKGSSPHDNNCAVKIKKLKRKQWYKQKNKTSPDNFISEAKKKQLEAQKELIKTRSNN